MNKKLKKDFINYLEQFVTQNKKDKIKQVVCNRTNYVTLLLEDLYKPMNASAIIRSCDCFGVQQVHAVESENFFKDTTGISKGAFKWVDVKRHRSVESAVKKLKQDGYKLVVTSPHSKKLLHELSLEKKIALAFGTEDEGISPELAILADEEIAIPMYGFTESFNVSVSVAICLYDIVGRLQRSKINWNLSEDEQQEVLLLWLKKIVRESDKYEQHFLKKVQKD